MDESGPLSARLCARCGVAVAPGYVKCPRCHAELPLARVRAGTATDGGGTVVAPGADRTVIYLGLGIVALVGLGVWLLTRDGGNQTATANPVVSEDLAAEDLDDSAPDPRAEAPPDRLPSPAPPPAPAVDPSAVVGALGRALRAEKLWATVSATGGVVVIDSSFCEDAALTAIVDGAAADLRAAELTLVRCRAPHGGVMFERGL